MREKRREKYTTLMHQTDIKQMVKERNINISQRKINSKYTLLESELLLQASIIVSCNLNKKEIWIDIVSTYVVKSPCLNYEFDEI